METEQTFRIAQLVVDRFKGAVAIDITPDRNVNIVSGRNGMGKTSILDAIYCAIGGKKLVPQKPIHSGEQGAQIDVILIGDETKEQLRVKRSFRADGKTEMEISEEGGFKAGTPQGILDSFFDMTSFDPLKFLRMDSEQQAETLRSLVGIDFAEMDAKHAKLYKQRADLNREAKDKAAQAIGIIFPDDTPKEEISIAALLSEQQDRLAENKTNDRERAKSGPLALSLKTAEKEFDGVGNQISIMEGELEFLQSKIAAARRCRERMAVSVETAKSLLAAQDATIAVLEDADVNEVNLKIAAAQGTNEMVRKAFRKNELKQQAEAANAKAKSLTAAMQSIESDKAQQLEEAEWPIEGLSFLDDGVTYQGIPLSQVSGAEGFRISAAIGASLSPKLKVMLMRDGSLLDDEQMQVAQDFAREKDIQLWIEVATVENKPGSIFIQEGLVVPLTPEDDF